jgi:transcriptional regulator with GAF, ATPase, and Fis domain
MSPTSDQTTEGREHRVSRAFVALADTLVADFDIADFLAMLTQRCTELLSVDAAGVILRSPHGEFQVVASSGRGAQLLERFAAETGDGPCIDCVHSGQPVICTDLSVGRARWPRFSVAAGKCGFRAVHALPMRYHHQSIGVLTLLNAAAHGVAIDASRLGQSFADVATIGILQQRTIDQGERLSQQLQAALTSRIAIEQAKGVLSQHGGVSMDEAFDKLRGYARAHQLRLTALAGMVADGKADLRAILAHPRG